MTPRGKPRKLTPAQHRAIRADPRPHQQIAECYGTSRRHISQIKAGLVEAQAPTVPPKRLPDRYYRPAW